jgi:hypothetical protein
VDVADQKHQANNNLLGALEIQGVADTPACAQRVVDAKQKIEQLQPLYGRGASKHRFRADHDRFA